MTARLAPWVLSAAMQAALSVLVPANAGADPPPLCFGQAATITGTDGPDVIRGTEGLDVIAGLGGDDIIQGRGGDDRICAADDEGGGVVTNDVLFGGAGNDMLLGTDHAGEAGGGWASGGPGDDTLDSTGVTYEHSPVAVTVDLEAGTASGWGNDTLHSVFDLRGSAYDDTLLGNDAPLDSEGACGCDIIDGLAGDDLLQGRVGWDRLYGRSGADVLYGGIGSDTLVPGRGRDRVYGGLGAGDTVSYFSATAAVTVDLAAGTSVGTGRDTLVNVEHVVGTRFADTIDGDGKANHLSGASGADVVHGRAGSDSLFGDEGRDTLRGGLGHDIARGGAGTDTCHAEDTFGCEGP